MPNYLLPRARRAGLVGVAPEAGADYLFGNVLLVGAMHFLMHDRVLVGESEDSLMVEIFISGLLRNKMRWFVVMLNFDIDFVKAVQIWLIVRLKNLLLAAVLSLPPHSDIVCYFHQITGVQYFRLSSWSNLDAIVKRVLVEMGVNALQSHRLLLEFIEIFFCDQLELVVWICLLLLQEEMLKRCHVNCRCIPLHDRLGLGGEEKPVDFISLLLKVSIVF